MARLGPHDSDRHQSVLPDRLESRIVSQDTDEHIQKPRTFIRREPQGDLGETGVLSRVQSREWFHVDGAYGALAAQVPGAPESLRALNEADSVAVDPHKWLYAPLEAGCVLVRRPDDLLRAFSYHPAYYHFDETAINYFDQGPQNSRGFRALKVWLALQQVGRVGAIGMIADDMRLSQHLDALVRRHPEFEAFTQQLSITTFRYVPSELKSQIGWPAVEKRIDEINQALLTRVEKSGEAFLSNAVVNGKFALRACIVNFRTSLVDIEALPPLLSRLGKDACRVSLVEPGLSPAERT
jgi:aromatic-L-amino-acid/L-tryptophan decarboxylase